MSQEPELGDLAGRWTYRSFRNVADLSTSFDELEFGRATLSVEQAPTGVLRGTIGGSGWSLVLDGAITYGDPHCLRFQGRGEVGGETWIYDYVGYVIAPWPHAVNQRPAVTGSVMRTVPHSGQPAGVVCSWIAVWQGPH